MNKLTGNEQIFDALSILSEGNPGAANVLMQLMSETEKIDKDSALGFAGVFYALDNLGIYGSDIWCLYKDVCYENIALFIAMLRSVQLGITSSEDLLNFVRAPRGSHDMNDTMSIYAKVCRQLPSFDKQL